MAAPQSYYIGGKIRAIDYNEFVNDINEIVGTGVGTSGYGMSNLVVSPITAGTKVKASHWDSNAPRNNCKYPNKHNRPIIPCTR